MPTDIRSFMVSYDEATEVKTSATRDCLEDEGTVWKPKCVVEFGASCSGICCCCARRREHEKQR